MNKRIFAVLLFGLCFLFPVATLGEKKGDVSRQVWQIQLALRDLALLKEEADGFYDAKTETAVSRFQSLFGLTATGEADEGTQALLFQAAEEAAKTGVSAEERLSFGLQSGMSVTLHSRFEECIRPMQRALITLGYLRQGSATGQLTDTFGQAMAAYRLQAGLPAGEEADFTAFFLALWQERAMLASEGMEAFSQLALLMDAHPQAQASAVPEEVFGCRLVSRGMKGLDVLILQTDLKLLGVYDGPISGEFGNLTNKALRRFQSREKMHVDGILGPTTAERILQRIREQSFE